MQNTGKFQIGKAFSGFDHIHWFVGNARITAEYYVSAFGFERVAFRGLETGYRSAASHVVRRNDIVFVFTSPYLQDAQSEFGDTFASHLSKHGDGVKDVAFKVDDCRATFREAVARGAKAVREPIEMKDEHGSVVLASLCTYGDTIHTLVERKQYRGVFLPGYVPAPSTHAARGRKPGTYPDLRFVDHVVGNQGDGEMEKAADWYREKLDFHRFWTVDDKQIHTEYSSLRSIVMADGSLKIKMPINEPASGLRKSQIQEFVEFYGGPGVQHIALNTPDCVQAVACLKARGVEFLEIPQAYYDGLKSRLAAAKINVGQDIDKLRELNILVDFDDSGFLLQIFTKPLQDRPTVFLEVIQRAGNEGFGAGNFKALFEAIERDQDARGNLSKL
jgi:4-hydroxyphenylpyruvate dioxygenase